MTYALVKPSFVIVEGERTGWSVEDCFWLPVEPRKRSDSWNLKRFAKLASFLSGRKIRTMKDAVAIIMNEAKSSPSGLNLVNLRVYKYKSPKTGREGQGIEYISGRPATKKQGGISSANSDGDTSSRTRST